MTMLPDHMIALVARRFSGQELIGMWGDAVAEGRLPLAYAYCAAIAEKCVREEIESGEGEGPSSLRAV